MNIKIYSKINCVFCDKAKMRLKKYNPEILILDIDYKKEDFFNKFPNAKTFPQIVIDDKNIGGYSDLKKWLEENLFDESF